ncbi:hypothetical protein ACFYVL_30105 [Streptomyces sp. NPDC004111]|uniref:hypothetical protein n=1 Tax=Streptomyces sp. NPDC004111 TaxID=3364690 RepID=UPI003689BDB4
MWIDRVTDILREAAAEAILPRHRRLARGEVAEKTPGEPVTVADRHAEALITRRRRGVRDVPVATEAGCAVGRPDPDGTPCRPSDDRSGLLAAAGPHCRPTARDHLLPTASTPHTKG